MSAEDQMRSHSWVPWDRPGEWVLWLVAIVLATIFIHNFTQWGGRVFFGERGGS